MYCRKSLNSLSHWGRHMHIYIYLYAYICVCVCVLSCVLETCATDSYGMYESMRKPTDHPDTV